MSVEADVQELYSVYVQEQFISVLCLVVLFCAGLFAVKSGFFDEG